MFVPLQILGNSATDWAVLAIAAFAGGAFGAALGALPAFCFTGIMVIAGEAVNVLKAELGAAGVVDPTAIGVGVTGSIAFGPVFGPHVSFAAGTAAAAYASRRGYMDTGFDYFEAKNITYALGTRPDVLAVGGTFGIFGMLVRQVSAGLVLPWDPIAMGVVVSAIAHRIVFGYSVIGRARGRGLLDMSPFEREEMRTKQEVSDRPIADGGEPVRDRRASAEPRSGDGEPSEESRTSAELRSDGGTVQADRLAVEPWLPHQYRWANVAMIGLVTGILAGFIAVTTGSPFLAFGISAATLLFLNLGVENIPVTHHITLVASTAALAIVASGEPAMLPALAVAALFGIYAALAGEVIQRVFYAHADTHFDPPAAAIVVGTFTIAVLYYVGVLPQAVWIPVRG